MVYRRWPYLVKDQVHIMARTVQISKEKQRSTITLRQEGAMMKLDLMRTATGKEDQELPLLQRISSLELPASKIAAQINASQSSSNTHISTSTVQRRLCESGLHGQTAAEGDLLGPRNTSKGH